MSYELNRDPMDLFPDLPSDPSRVIWLAVLDRAVLDWVALEKARDARPTVETDALFRNDVRKLKRWFRSKTVSEGSFAWICDIAQWDPVAAREKIFARIENGELVVGAKNHSGNPDTRKRIRCAFCGRKLPQATKDLCSACYKRERGKE